MASKHPVVQKAEKIQEQSFFLDEIIEAWEAAAAVLPDDPAVQQALAAARKIRGQTIRWPWFHKGCNNCQLLEEPASKVCFYCVTNRLKDDMRPHGEDSLAWYGPPSRGIRTALTGPVLDMKTDGARWLTWPLGKLLAGAMRRDPNRFGKVQVILPAPIRPASLAKRGYNQNELIAKVAADILGLEAQAPAFRVVKQLQAQHELKSAEERRANVRGAFRLVDPAAVKGKHLLIIDDVTTFRATMDELESVCLGAGARSVIGMALGKTVGHD